MKRLTEKRFEQNVIPLRRDGKTKWSLHRGEKGEQPALFLYGSHADRLSAYEDTGLAPEQIVEIDKLYAEQAKELAELKKIRTPKKPTYEGDGYSDGEMVYDTWICPCCDTEYEVDYDEYDYCPNCGQAIDWSDNE